jgi:hypothetical protein
MPQDENGTLLRPRYFDRQQLVAADLNLGLQYVQGRLRRHNRYLHGWGVVCGAEVRQVDAADNPWLFQVGEGYAVTPRGDEIYIPPGVTIDLETPALGCLGTSEDCPDVHLVRAMIDPPGRDVRSDYNDEWVEIGLTDTMSLNGYVVQHTLNIDTPRQRLSTYYTFSEDTVFEAGSIIRIHSGAADRHDNPPADRMNRYVADPGELGNWRFNNVRDRLRILDPAGNVIDEQIFLPDSELPIGAGTVYLAVCAQEELCQPQVAMPELCTPAGGSYDFSRVCEGYRLRLLCDLPPAHAAQALSCAELEAIICGEALPPCPPAVGADDDCVVLATIRVRATPIDVDNLRDRRILLSESLLQAYLRCRCDEAPAPTPAPTEPPTPAPTGRPTPAPTGQPTLGPTFRPTLFPTGLPTLVPPTFIGTFAPTFIATPTPTFFPTFIGPTEIIIPSRFPIEPIDLDNLDVDRGRTLPVSDIRNIGPARRALLEEAGIDNVFLFATRPATELAEILNVSEVQVAEMQLRARELMRRGGNG